MSPEMQEARNHLREAEQALAQYKARRKDAIYATRRAALAEEDAWMNPMSDKGRQKAREEGDRCRRDVDGWCACVEKTARFVQILKKQVEQLKEQEAQP